MNDGAFARAVALVLVLLLVASPGSGLADDIDEAERDRSLCERTMQEVLVVLESRADMRDEAYTAIMWHRLDAERAWRAGDGALCVQHLEVPLRILGLYPVDAE